MATPVIVSGYPKSAARYGSGAYNGQASGAIDSPTFTPPASRLLLVFGWSSEDATLNISGGGLTWSSPILSATYPRVYAWWTVSPSSPASMKVTITATVSSTHLGVVVYAFDSAKRGIGGTNATTGYAPGTSPYQVAAPGGVATGSLLIGGLALTNLSNIGTFSAMSGCVEDFGTGTRDYQGVETASPWARRWSVGRINSGSAYGGTVSATAPIRAGGVVVEVPGVSILGVTPGGASAGDTITISGSGFTGTTPTVTVGGTPATGVTVVNDTTITATVPGGVTPGQADVEVTIDGTSTTLPDAVVYNAINYGTIETLAYKTASLHTDGTFLWDLASLRRGAWGTTIGAHPAGATFMDTATALRVALPQSRFDVPLYVKLVPFNVYGGGRPELADVPAHAFNVPLQGSVAPTTATLTVLVSAPAPATNQWREASTDNLHGRLARVQWTFTAPTTTKIAPHRGFEVVVFTGTDPTDTSKYLRIIETVDNIRDAVIGVSNATASPITIRAAVRALYADGLKSPWRTTGSDTLPANTSPVQQAVADAANALTLAGSGTKVFFQTSAPTSGMRNGDIWYDTTSYVDSDGTTKKRYTPYRYNVSVWEPYDKQLIVASEIAAGAIVADKIAANAIDVSRLTVGTVSDNLWPNATSENAPPTGADTTGAEFGWRSPGFAYSGDWKRYIATSGVQLWLPLYVPCSPGASFYLEAMVSVVGTTAGVAIDFADSAGNPLTGLDGAGSTFTSSSSWTKCWVSSTAPANAVRARLYLHCEPGGSASFDSMVARRMIGGELVVNGSITADKIAGNQIKTPNYAFTGTEGGADEVATAGAKMQNAPGGTALLVAPGNLLVGKMNFSRMFSFGVISIDGASVSLLEGLNITVGGWTTQDGVPCISVELPGAGPGSPTQRAITFGVNRMYALSTERIPYVVGRVGDSSGGHISYIAFSSTSGWYNSSNMPHTELSVIAMQPFR